MTEWEGDEYQARFDRMAASGQDMHGEARFVLAFDPGTVLDAGCGTGRERGPDVAWVETDLRTMDLGWTFDLVVMAGNVHRPTR